jgi:hypothetical protein
LFSCLKGLWVHPYTVILAKLAPDFKLMGHLWSEMMPLRHGWGWYPPQTASHIWARHIQSVWAIDMLPQGHTMGAPLYQYTGQVGPRFCTFGSLVEWKWCHYIMVGADIHLRLLPTSILDLYKVFEVLFCCLKGTLVSLYQQRWPQILEFGSFVEWKWCHYNGWGCHPPQTASHIHIRHIKCVQGIVLLSQGLMGAPSYRYTR